MTLYRRQGSRSSPKKKKCKKAKLLSKEALQIAEKRREAKGKGGKRYTHQNAEFQRITRKDKKTFLRNRGKQQNGKDQRSLQKNQRYQGNISYKIGTIKDINDMDLTETEDIKKRWQEYTEDLY